MNKKEIEQIIRIARFYGFPSKIEQLLTACQKERNKIIEEEVKKESGELNEYRRSN